MTDVVGAELALDPVYGFGERAAHDGRIVDQDINLLDAGIDVCSALSNGGLAT